MAERYSTPLRREYLRDNLSKYDYESKAGYSLRDIAYDVKVAFSLEKAPSASTIRNDLEVIQKEKVGPRTLTAEAERLLLPENFAEWRSTAFRAPGNKEYQTPPHQLAWFHLVLTLALKIELPEWVEEYLQVGDLNINDWAENPERLMSLFLLAPPRHGKSDLLGHVMMWLIMRNPDIRIIWCGGKLEISELTTAWVKGELESNEFLIDHYGPFENEGSWSDKRFTVATRQTRMRMPTMMAVGKNTTILSLDADFIVVDDFVDLKASESPTQQQKDQRWVTSQLFSRREPWTPLFGIGSHQPSPVGDCYSLLENQTDSEIVFVKQKAHEYADCLPLEDDMEQADRHGEHCLLWAGVRPWWFLESMRKALGDTVYEVCYNQDESQAKIAYFRDKVVRGSWPLPIMDHELGRYKDADVSERTPGILDRNRSFGQRPHCCGSDKLLTVIGFDPASGQSRSASESALIVLGGCPTCGRRYLIDMWHKRQSPEKHPAIILDYQQMYAAKRVRIEINAYQRALARDKDLVGAQATKGFLIDEWETGATKHDPAMGIPILSRHMETGKFSVPYMLPQDQDKAEAMLGELIRWPQAPNDIVMGLWLAELSVQQYITDFSHNTPEMFGSIDDVPAYMLVDIPTIHFGPTWNTGAKGKVVNEQGEHVSLQQALAETRSE